MTVLSKYRKPGGQTTRLSPIVERFDAHASLYDEKASFQEYVAQRLVVWASSYTGFVGTIFDIGSGTGFVADAAHQQWPGASIYAFDPSAHMLQQAKRKLPSLKTIQADAVALPAHLSADVIFSSMMLHWIDKPLDVIRSWQERLHPEGRIYVALLVQDSFPEWQMACQKAGVESGLWAMPTPDFAASLSLTQHEESLTMSYASALDFLRLLKSIGAATPRAGHQPMKASEMRKILADTPKPFHVTYRVLYLEIGSGD